MDSVNDISAIPAAAGSSAPAPARPGSSNLGRPPLTGPTSATPRSSRSANPTSAIPTTTTTSGPGTLGAQRRSPSSTASPPRARATVAGLASPSCRSADHAWAKKLSPSTRTPSTLPSWLAAMTSPMPALKPASTGEEMKSARNPRRSRPAATRMPATSRASSEAVAAARPGSSAAPAWASASAVRMEMVEVELTLSGREVPSSA
jgi:hypothetical protein